MKMRTIKERILVDKTIGGKTHQVPREVEREEPVIPRDLDAIVLRAVIGATYAVVAAAIVWSTVSIGSLLSAVAPTWAAYLIAGVFDLAWVVCMWLEWLGRLDAIKARIPRKFGHWALVVSMVLIAFHGYQSGSLGVGIAGAMVSAVAKLLWTLVMQHISVELDSETAQWLRAEKSELAAQTEVEKDLRRLEERRARLQVLTASRAQRQTYGTTVEVSRDVTEPVSRDVPEPVPVSRPAEVPVEDVPELSQEATVTTLDEHPPGVSVRARELLKKGLGRDDVRDILYREFGDDTRTKETVRRSLNRIAKNG